jgi:hypothetical protein
VLPRASARVVAIAAGATATALVIVLVVVGVARGPAPPIPDYPREIAIPLGVLLLVAVLAFAGWWLLRATAWRGLQGAGMAVFCATTLAVFTLQGPAWTADQAWSAVTSTRPALPAWKVGTPETLAAQWVSKNVPRDDIIATNVHCLRKKTTPGCDGRAYWVAALTERRILVESWAYTEETLRQIGQHPGGFGTYPFDDPELYQANEQAFKNPTAEGLATLRDKYHVRWLFADRLAGPVSPELAQLAQLRLSNKHVQVFELYH